MIEWLNANIAYWHWFIFGLSLVFLEIILFSFVVLWFGLSAVIVGLLLWVFPFSVTLQLTIWVVLSIFIALAWFKWISPYLKNNTFSSTPRKSVIGKVGTVIECNSTGGKGQGTLRFPAPILGNDEWQFICTDIIVVGDRVSVREFSEDTLIVSAK